LNPPLQLFGRSWSRLFLAFYQLKLLTTADPAVTLRVYGYLFAGAQEELIERLDSLRRGSSRTSGVSDIADLGRASRSGKP